MEGGNNELVLALEAAGGKPGNLFQGLLLFSFQLGKSVAQIMCCALDIPPSKHMEKSYRPHEFDATKYHAHIRRKGREW